MRLNAIKQIEANWEVRVWWLGMKAISVWASISGYDKCKCKDIDRAAVCYPGEQQANQWPRVK